MPLEQSHGDTPHTGLTGYSVAYAALLTLTAATYLSSRLELGGWSLPVAMAIACTKAAIVVLIFMHLKDHGGTNRAYFIAGLFYIALLIGLILTDVLTRVPMARPHDVSREILRSP